MRCTVVVLIVAFQIGLLAIALLCFLHSKPVRGAVASAVCVLSLWLWRKPASRGSDTSLPSGERETGFGQHIRQNLGTAGAGLLAFFSGMGKAGQDTVGLVYYWQWNRKTQFKRILRKLSFGVVVFSSGILLLEAAGDYFGADQLVEWLRSLPVSETTRLAVFLGAAVFLVLHYQSEIRKPEHEYIFITRLLTVMSRQRAQNDTAAVLAIFHALFEKAGNTPCFHLPPHR